MITDVDSFDPYPGVYMYTPIDESNIGYCDFKAANWLIDSNNFQFPTFYHVPLMVNDIMNYHWSGRLRAVFDRFL